MARVLIIGRRRRCYLASIQLGHETFLWSDGPLHESRKKRLSGWIEHPFSASKPHLSQLVLEEARHMDLDFVVAATESSVSLAAQLRAKVSLPGTTMQTSHLLHNKFAMKEKARACRVPVTDYVLVDSRVTAQELMDRLGLPLVMKPVSESGARGVVICRNQQDVAAHFKPGLLAEAFVDGKEVSVETFVRQGEPIFHNITDYLHQWRKSLLPASLPPELSEEILQINDRVIRAFGVENGMTHAEFYLSSKGPIFGEMAVRPPGGYYMELIEEAYGFDTWKTYLELETGRAPIALPQAAKQFAAVLMVHPGPGVIEDIRGADEMQKMDEVFQFKFKAKIGDLVSPHESTSNEVGHVLMRSPCSERLRSVIGAAENLIDVTMMSKP